MTHSRNQRNKQLRREKGLSTKAQARKDKKILEERQRRLKNRPQELRIKNTKIQRNDPCPCNSGKKFKHCCSLLSKEDTLSVESTEEK
jgi:uncharacterized protein YecA (UPF0149 family)